MDHLADLLSVRARHHGPLGHASSGVREYVPGLVAGSKYNFGGGGPDPGSFPYQDLVRAMADVVETDGAPALSYGSWDGFQGLREWVAHRYRVLENLEVAPEQVLITNGSGDALGLVVQTFVDVGDPVFCESPVFVGGLQIFRRNGADLQGILVDADGMRTDLLAERLAALVRAGRRPKLIYTIPTFQNPTGTTLTAARRHELLDLARAYDVAVLEDDAYGEMRLDGVPVPSLFELDGGVRVVRTGTLSKTLGAGVRVGWLVAPPALLDYIAGFNFAGSVSPLTSRVCAAYLREHFEPHLAELREIYRVKRDTLLDALDEGLQGTGASWIRPDGGFFVWLRLPPGTDGRRLAELARAQGIGYMPGPYFMLTGGGEDHIRLAYSSMTVEQLRAGTQVLCEVIRAARP